MVLLMLGVFFFFCPLGGAPLVCSVLKASGSDCVRSAGGFWVLIKVPVTEICQCLAG